MSNPVSNLEGSNLELYFLNTTSPTNTHTRTHTLSLSLSQWLSVCVCVCVCLCVCVCVCIWACQAVSLHFTFISFQIQTKCCGTSLTLVDPQIVSSKPRSDNQNQKCNKTNTNLHLLTVAHRHVYRASIDRGI